MAILKPLTKLRKIYEKQNGAPHPALGTNFKVSKQFSSFDSFARSNIIEVRFLRKIPPKISSMKFRRRMLCTKNFIFLYELYKMFPGYFNYPIIKNKRKVRTKQWYKSKNIIIVWDILQNDFRMIHLRNWKIIDFQPFKTKEDLQAFSEFFYKYLKHLSITGRRRYYNK